MRKVLTLLAVLLALILWRGLTDPEAGDPTEEDDSPALAALSGPGPADPDPSVVEPDRPEPGKPPRAVTEKPAPEPRAIRQRAPRRPGSNPPAPDPRPPPPGTFRVDVVNGHATWLGDIIIGEAEEVAGEPLRPRLRIWPGGIVPYEIHMFENTGRIEEAVAMLNAATNVRFVDHTDEEDYIVFEKGEGCYSYVGRKGGRQPVFLGDECRTGNVLHELMHVLGFYHEQNRPDRDEHIQVHWINIQPDRKTQYQKLAKGLFFYLDSPFDFESVMLYGSFSNFGVRPDTPTMTNLEDQPFEANRSALSYEDIRRINRLAPPPQP